jgi:molybdopterin-guanine dinucleotide biosynthesis protein A
VSVTGFVVAGGESRRMRRDKALLPWGEADLLDHSIARLRAVTGDVRILCGPEARYADRGLPVEPDLVSGAGPLGGVLTGLVAVPGRSGLFLAVDLPHVPVALLARLVERADGDAASWDAVVPVSRRGPEPLCALYGPGCRGPIRRRMEAGDFRMTGFWPEVRVLEVGPSELEEFGDPAEVFRNLNAPEDLPTK